MQGTESRPHDRRTAACIIALTTCLVVVASLTLTASPVALYARLLAPLDRTRLELDHSQSVTKPNNAIPQNLRILIYITTHLSEQHILYLDNCWPSLFANSRLFRQADVAIFLANSGGDTPVNMTFINSVFPPQKVRAIYVHPNPGHQEGAVLAMNEGFERGYFTGYDWVIRVNPDVLIRNDTWLLETFDDEHAHGVFADCHDIVCVDEQECTKRIIMTDFFAFRPDRIASNAFKEAYKTEKNAELQATLAFAPMVQRGNDRWLLGAGPHGNFCRVGGKSSPVVHDHELSSIFPACLAWYRNE